MLKKDLVKENSIIPTEIITQRIFFIRGQKVMLDADLAELYGIQVKVLIQSVKRNKDRFPDDFMFQLSKEEFGNLRSQFVTSRWGGRRYLPYAFTEHGVAMLASVLKSKRATEMSIFIVRTFIKLREILASNKDLVNKIEDLQKQDKVQNKHINNLYSLIDKLLEEPVKTKNPIGFSK